MRVGKFGLSLGIALFATIAIFVVAPPRCAHANKQTSASARVTEPQIREKTARLLFSLYPQKDRFQVNSEPRALLLRDNTRRTLWTVECSDDTDHYLAFLAWDADTGRLLKMCRRDVTPPWSSLTALRGKAILRAVRRGLDSLDLEEMTIGLRASC